MIIYITNKYLSIYIPDKKYLYQLYVVHRKPSQNLEAQRKIWCLLINDLWMNEHYELGSAVWSSVCLLIKVVFSFLPDQLGLSILGWPTSSVVIFRSGGCQVQTHHLAWFLSALCGFFCSIGLDWTSSEVVLDLIQHKASAQALL